MICLISWKYIPSKEKISMKRKAMISVLLMCALCFVACKEETELDETSKVVVQQEETLNEETPKDEITIETINETSDILEETTEEDLSTVKVVENEYGAKYYYADAEHYMDAYRKYLNESRFDNTFYVSIYDSEYDCVYDTPYFSSVFGLADINGDGMKELIVSGALGLRDKLLTAISFWQDNTFVSLEYGGEPDLIGSNMVYFNDPDYGGAGEELYSHEYVVLFDDKGNGTIILSSNKKGTFVEVDNVTGEYVLEYEIYEIEGEEVSEEDYASRKEELLSQMKSFELYDNTLENIEKYVTE